MHNVLVILQLGHKTMFQFFCQWFFVSCLISKTLLQIVTDFLKIG